MALIAVQNIDLMPEIKQWEDAYCGEDVRQAAVDAYKKIQTSVNQTVQNVNTVAGNQQQVINNAQQTIDRANEINDESAERIKLAEAWAHGHADYPDRAKDNAKYWSSQSENSATTSGNHAKTAESWAVGGTNTRDGENTDNSKYWSTISQRQAETAKNEADRAAQYSQIVAPGFYLDNETMTLYMKAGVGVVFGVFDGILAWQIAG